MRPLGLPDPVRACLFDLDGVLTSTAAVHAAAWKQVFDAFLRTRRGQGTGPFDAMAVGHRVEREAARGPRPGTPVAAHLPAI